MLLEQLPFLASIRDHSLHHIVNRDKIGENAMTFVIWDGLKLGGDNGILQGQWEQLFRGYQVILAYC